MQVLNNKLIEQNIEQDVRTEFVLLVVYAIFFRFRVAATKN